MMTMAEEHEKIEKKPLFRIFYMNSKSSTPCAIPNVDKAWLECLAKSWNTNELQIWGRKGKYIVKEVKE